MLKTYCFDGQPHFFEVLEAITEYRTYNVAIIKGHIFYCQKCLMKVEVVLKSSE